MLTPDGDYRPRIEDLPVAVYLCDTDGRLLRYNSAAADLWGRTPQPGEQLGAGSDSPVQDPIARVLKEERPLLNVEVVIDRPDGDRRYVLANPLPVRDATGGLAGALSIVVDITERKRAEAALAESEEMMRSIIDSSPDCLKVLDLEGRLVTMNAKGCDAMDIENFDAYRNQQLASLWPEGGKHAIEDAIWRARAGEPSRFEGRCPTAKGVEKWWEVTVSPILDGAGKPSRILTISRDITDRHRTDALLRESNERFTSAFVEAPIGLVLLTPEGRILEANPAFQQMVGRTMEELQGGDSGPITHPEDVEATRKFFQSFHTPGSPVVLEKRYLHKDGRTVWGRASVTVRRDYWGKVEQLTAIVEDITSRKVAEQERDRLVQELKRSNEELSMFAHIAAHDLRSPLRMVKSYTTLLERHLKAKLDGDGREYMTYIQNGAAQMDHLIEGLLKFAQVGSEDPEPVSVQTEGILESALLNLEPLMAEAHAQVMHGALPVVRGEETQLLQLFQNLIANAIKYRRVGVAPEIEVSASRKGHLWSFAIADNGQGIPEQYFEHIFKPLKRLHGVEVQGTGLGLAICQKIVERHGGRIWLESTSGAGSTFHFTLRAEA